MYRGRIYNCLGALIALGFAAVAHPQATSNSLSVRAIAEFETHNAEGRETSKLAAADKVVPGDRIDLETVLLRTRSSAGWVSGEARVDGKLCCAAELMFAVSTVEDFGMDATILHQ